MADNRCICCGEIIPEGMIACPNCLVVSKRQATENKWIPVSERLPESGKHVLAACVTPCGQYVCDAYYCSARSITGGCGDDLATVYDEDDDEYYLMPGWYEVIKNWDDYNSITIYDIVTHWMPLPELPKEGE